MKASSEALVFQGEKNPLINYSPQDYESLDSSKSELVACSTKQKNSRKCLVLSFAAIFAVVGGAILLAALIALPIVLTSNKHHGAASLATLTTAEPSTINFTFIDAQNTSSADQKLLEKLTSDWRALNFLPDGEDNAAETATQLLANDPALNDYADQSSYFKNPTMLRASRRKSSDGSVANSRAAEDQDASEDLYAQTVEIDIVENFDRSQDEQEMNGNVAARHNVDVSSVSSGEEPEDPTVDKVQINTKLGNIVGLVKKSRQGRDYFAFLKVPYAMPPIGKRRFKPPVAQDGWKGTLDATVAPPLCIQKVKYSSIVEATGAEDCLYMSIYTPKLPTGRQQRAKLFPVMFYIHGGGFTDGNGFRYGANYFMDEDVVLITFQYRLGPFGFLNTKDGDILGNMGFKDQVEGLKFVRRIISDFNGDASRVTIFGNSAGAQCVNFHLVSPMSKGLFSRAIAQSGNSVAAFNVDKSPEVTAKIVAERFNCTNGRRTLRKQKLSDCLRNVDAADLALVRPLKARYMATIEETSADPFLTDMPLNLMRNGKINRVPLITGVNSAEGLPQTLIFLSTPLLSYLMNKDWPLVAPLLFQLNSSAFDDDALSYRIRDFFFGNQSVNNDTLSNLTALCSDRMFGHTTQVVARYHSAVSPVYLYYLTKRPAKSYGDKNLKGWPPGDYGVAHADELQYMFLYDGYPEINTSSEYFNFSSNLVKAWAKFAADGKPDDAWLQFKPHRQEKWYNLDDSWSMTDALVARMKLWDSYSAHDLSYE